MNSKIRLSALFEAFPRTIISTVFFFTFGLVSGLLFLLLRGSEADLAAVLCTSLQLGGILALGALAFLPIDAYRLLKLRRTEKENENRGRTEI